MSVGALVKFRNNLSREPGWHSILGTLIRLPSRQRDSSSRCVVMWMNGAEGRPAMETLEIIEEPKKIN